MKETEFKALMHCGEYIDFNLLEDGIYPCHKPFIYSKDTTIESLIERGRMIIDVEGECILPRSYFYNLNQCILVHIKITEMQ